MSDLIRRSEFKAKCIEVLEGIREHPLMSRQEMHVIAAIDTVCQIADDIPAVDAVEVVRCRECEHRATFKDDFGAYTVCRKRKDFTRDDDFCSRGQRREDGDGDG